MVLGSGKMRYIAPRHGFDQYPVEAWTGMSSTSVDLGGPDDELMSHEWLSKNVHVGLLGQHYPGIEFSAEGDTPALLYNIPNGLGDAEHADWGSWGGSISLDAMTSTAMPWTRTPLGASISPTTPRSGDGGMRCNMSLLHGCSGLYARGTLIPLPLCPPMVIVNGSCGLAALQVMVEAGETVTLDASASYSPDSNARLNFTWFQYYEPSSYQASPGDVPTVNLTNISEIHGDRVKFTVPGGNDKCVRAEDVTESGHWGEASKCPVLHVAVAAKVAGAVHPITRYRRILLQVQPHE
jgi:hypothetical protein